MNKMVIFDLDGVITDTNLMHYKSWVEVANALDESLSEKEYHTYLTGLSKSLALKKILELKNKQVEDMEHLIEVKNKKLDHLIGDISENDVFKNIRATLESLKFDQYRLVVYSGSTHAGEILEKTNLDSYFEEVIDISGSMNDKSNHKNFERVLEKYQVSPNMCVGIEDSNISIAAMKRAGLLTVGVGGAIEEKNADVIVDDGNELDYSIIKKLIESEVM